MKPFIPQGQPVKSQPARLTDDQVTRVILAWRHLANNGNLVAQALTAALNGADPERQRQMVANATAEAYGVLLSANMAIASQRPPAQVRDDLAKGRTQ